MGTMPILMKPHDCYTCEIKSGVHATEVKSLLGNVTWEEKDLLNHQMPSIVIVERPSVKRNTIHGLRTLDPGDPAHFIRHLIVGEHMITRARRKNSLKVFNGKTH